MDNSKNSLSLKRLSSLPFLLSFFLFPFHLFMSIMIGLNLALWSMAIRILNSTILGELLHSEKKNHNRKGGPFARTQVQTGLFSPGNFCEAKIELILFHRSN